MSRLLREEQLSGAQNDETLILLCPRFFSPVSVAASEPRHKWLDCPEGALALEMTASTSAGEGRHGPRVSSRPSSSEGQSLPPSGSLQKELFATQLKFCSITVLCLTVGMAIMIVFVVAVAGGILTNIMCWGCVRRRCDQPSLLPATGPRQKAHFCR